MTTSFSVVGSPIEHSLSPVLHTAAYKHLELRFAYGKNEVPVGGLRDSPAVNQRNITQFWHRPPVEALILKKRLPSSLNREQFGLFRQYFH